MKTTIHKKTLFLTIPFLLTNPYFTLQSMENTHQPDRFYQIGCDHSVFNHNRTKKITCPRHKTNQAFTTAKNNSPYETGCIYCLKEKKNNLTLAQIFYNLIATKVEGNSPPFIDILSPTLTPRSLKNFAFLKKLILPKCQLKNIPNEIEELTNLEEIDFRENQLSVLPTTINKLTQLTTLCLHDNQFTTIQPEICLLPRLLVFILSQNKLKAIPPTIGQAPKLQRLLIDRNPLEKLPNEIFSITSLKFINLYQTKIPPETIELYQTHCGNLLRILSSTDIYIEPVKKKLENEDTQNVPKQPRKNALKLTNTNYHPTQEEMIAYARKELETRYSMFKNDTINNETE